MIEYEGKKLYIVSVEYQAYVLAKDIDEAEEQSYKIERDGDPTVWAFEASGDPKNPLDWPTHSCIYHSQDDMRDIDLWKVIGV